MTESNQGKDFGIDIGKPKIEATFDRINSGTAVKGKNPTNTHAKMKRGQSGIGQLFAEHYGEKYYQTEGSGAGATQRAHQMDASDAKSLAGDVRVSHALFVLEVKAGYDWMHLHELFFVSPEAGKTVRDKVREWEIKLNRDAKLCGLFPIIALKQTRRGWLIFFPESYSEAFMPHMGSPNCTMRYDKWVIVRREDFFKIPKHLLFETEAQTADGAPRCKGSD